MKKYSTFKIIQLALLAVLTLLSIYLLFQPQVKAYVFSAAPATALFFVVWLLLLAGFLFILADFHFISNIKMNYHNLYDVAYSDPLSGMPNRFSCDTVIEKYYDQKLPDTISCVMIDLTNLPEVNQLHGHATGNRLLKDFSSILSASALSVCFVGRNGGNKFLAIFETGDQSQIDLFLARIADRVKQHNQAADAIEMQYRAGVAQNREEHLEEITRLIALANKRIYED